MRSGRTRQTNVPAYHPSAPLKVERPAADSGRGPVEGRELPLSLAGARIPARR